MQRRPRFIACAAKAPEPKLDPKSNAGIAPQQILARRGQARLTTALDAEIGFLVERLAWFWSNHFLRVGRQVRRELADRGRVRAQGDDRTNVLAVSSTCCARSRRNPCDAALSRQRALDWPDIAGRQESRPRS
jgi:hypothetical protein